jgi:hypothetical protein
VFDAPGRLVVRLETATHRFHRGAELTLWNTDAAPFDGSHVDPATAGRASLEGLLPYPEVLQIRVADGPRQRREVPSLLASDFQRAKRDVRGADAVHGHAHVGGLRSREPLGC